MRALILQSIIAICLFCVPAVASEFGRNQCQLVTDTSTHTPPATTKPAYMGSYTDPVFGTTVTRITGNVGDTIPTVGGTWGDLSQPGYTTRAVWNADQSLILLDNTNAASGLYLDGSTYAPLFVAGRPGDELRWHPTNPALMNYLHPATCEIGTWNPQTNSATALKTVSGYTGCSMGNTGNWSDDGTRIAVAATRTSDSKSVVFAVNLTTGDKYPDIVSTDHGILSTDYVSISPLGDLIYINGGLESGDNQSDNTIIVDAVAGTQVGSAWTEYATPSHADLAIDVNGNEVAVGTKKSSPDAGKVIMRDLRTGAQTIVDDGGWATFTSTRNKLMPGWAFVTHYNCSGSYLPYCDEAFAVKLAGTPTVPRLVHLQINHYVNYAIPSPDGTRVLFSSDWREESGVPSQTYVADLRPLCTSIATTPSPSNAANVDPQQISDGPQEATQHR